MVAHLRLQFQRQGQDQDGRGTTSLIFLRSPLTAGLNKRNGRKLNSFSKRRVSPPTSPVNMYIGENFSVRLFDYFNLQKLVKDNASTGMAMTEFDSFKTMDHMELSDAAQKIRDVPNAGGNSVVSEVLSYELLKRCFGATLLKTEMEVSYFPEGGSITDYVCEMFDTTIGVSVTRAMKYKGPFTEDDAHRLLNKKLNGIVQSSKNSLEKWSKQILHIWATSKHVANTIIYMYDRLPTNVKSNSLVLVTVARRSSEIFRNR